MFTPLQARGAECDAMLLSFPVALAMLADAPAQSPALTTPAVAAASTGTSAPPEPSSNGAHAPPTGAAGPSPATTTANACPQSSADSRQIVICAERPEGYRLNPDVMEAKREAHSAGRPVRPGGTIRPDCATVGPQPCMNAGVNLLAAAATLAQMGQRVAKGQEVGSMFQTDPHPDEYHLYLMAKARREEAEKEKAAQAWKKAHPPATAANIQPLPTPPVPSVQSAPPSEPAPTH